MHTMRGSASRILSRFPIAFCAGVAATLAWWYGHAARQMIANSHPLFGWLAPAEPVTQKRSRHDRTRSAGHAFVRSPATQHNVA
jgi:hypothetical protein